MSLFRPLLLLFLCWTLLVLPAIGQEEEDANKNKPLVVAGYLPDYRSTSININASAPYLTDLLLFSVQPHSRGMIGGCCLNPTHYEIARQAKKYHNPNLKLWVTVGGFGRNDSFRAVAADPKRRWKFIKALIRLW
jgi:GH18 family chitinase